MWPGRPPLRASTSRHRRLDDGPRGQADGRVEVALDAPCRRRRARGRRRAAPASRRPTTSAPASAIRPSSSPVPTPKWMRGTPRSASAGEHLAAVRAARSARSRSGVERAGPRVEELDGRRPGLDLGAQRGDGQVGQAVDQRRARAPASPCISALVRRVGARRAALDQVAGHGERRAGEADERAPSSSLDQDAHGLEHVGRVGLGLERAEAVEVGGASGTAARRPGRCRARRRRRSRWRRRARRCRSRGWRRRRRSGAPAAG